MSQNDKVIEDTNVNINNKTKTCNTCNNNKGIDSFYKGKSTCKTCTLDIRKKIYTEKREEIINSNIQKYKENKNKLQTLVVINEQYESLKDEHENMKQKYNELQQKYNNLVIKLESRKNKYKQNNKIMTEHIKTLYDKINNPITTI